MNLPRTPQQRIIIENADIVTPGEADLWTVFGAPNVLRGPLSRAT